MQQVRVEYDGEYPCLCAGHLQVWVGDDYYDFGDHCLCSGGCICHDEDWDMWAEEGDWSIDETKIPKDFPMEYKDLLIDVINQEIPHGCCGGCI